MQLNIQRPVLSLEAGQLVTLDDAAGRRITACSGTVWITEEGSRKDFIVGPGEVLVVGRGGRTIVQALQSARVSIQ